MKREAVLEKIERIKEQLVEKYKPEKIILFGSAARMRALAQLRNERGGFRASCVDRPLCGFDSRRPTASTENAPTRGGQKSLGSVEPSLVGGSGLWSTGPAPDRQVIAQLTAGLTWSNVTTSLQ